MKRLLVVGLGVLCAALPALTGCKKKEEAAKKPTPPPSVVVAAVVQQDVPVYGEWIGTTAGDINAGIRPQITGYLVRRVYAEGSFVHQGELLFEIDPRQIQAQVAQARANLGQAEASLANAERDVARYRPLAEQRALSQQELDHAVSAEQVARANVEAVKAAVDQARLNLSWTKVTSLIGGIAGTALAQVGDLVTPQTLLVNVSRVDPLRVLFNLSEQEYLRYSEGSRADPAHPANPAILARIGALELVLSDGSVFPHQGRLVFTDRQVDVKTGTIGAVGLFPNPGNLLRPGQYAKVRAETGIDKGALLVPQRAVNQLQGGYQVAVVRPDDMVEIRNVKAGQRVGSLWVVDRGLKAGERVVVEGFSRVKSGEPANPQAAPAQAAAPPDKALATSPSSPSGR